MMSAAKKKNNVKVSLLCIILPETPKCVLNIKGREIGKVMT